MTGMSGRFRDFHIFPLCGWVPISRIWCFLFGSWFKSQLRSLVSGVKQLLHGLVPISRKKKKKVSQQERRARAKVRVKKFRHRALSVALVVRCWRRPSNKRSLLVTSVSTTLEPMHWKWKKRPKIGLESVMASLQPGTIASFCEGHHDFLRLPKLMGTLCNHDYHVKQIKSVLD